MNNAFNPNVIAEQHECHREAASARSSRRVVSSANGQSIHPSEPRDRNRYARDFVAPCNLGTKRKGWPYPSLGCQSKVSAGPVLNPDGRACAAYRDPLCLKTQLLRATEIAVLTVDQPEIRAQAAVTKSEFMTPDGEMVVVVTSLAVTQVRPIAGPEVAHVRSIWRAFHCAMSEPK